MKRTAKRMVAAANEYLRALSTYWPTARALSPSGLSTIPLFLSMLSIPVRKRIFGRTPKRLRIFLGGKCVDFYVRDGLDIAVLREMFVDKEYNLTGIAFRTPTRIADLGAHIGAAVLFLRSCYPNASFIAYEPDPDNFALLKRNVGSLPRVECIHAAVAAASGTVLLYTHSGGSTRGTLSRDPDSTGEIRVPAVSFADVVQRGVDCVKFDIEGSEYDLFASSQDEIGKVPVYIGEFHAGLTGKTPAQFEKLFPGFKFSWSHGALVTILKE